MKIKNSFIALNNILDAAEGLSQVSKLDPTSKSILKFIAHQNNLKTNVCITDIAESSYFKSSKVTLLKKTQALIKLGWLEEKKSNIHHRRNDLILSKFAIKELDLISRQLDRSLKQGLYSE